MLYGPLTFRPRPREGEMASTGEIGLSNDADAEDDEVNVETALLSSLCRQHRRPTLKNFFADVIYEFS
jgi:hypothetical protein